MRRRTSPQDVLSTGERVAENENASAVRMLVHRQRLLGLSAALLMSVSREHALTRDRRAKVEAEEAAKPFGQAL